MLKNINKISIKLLNYQNDSQISKKCLEQKFWFKLYNIYKLSLRNVHSSVKLVQQKTPFTVININLTSQLKIRIYDMLTL